jgi:ubiquinone/menaquinone biosynthesis C-methylase UbiE
MEQGKWNEWLRGHVREVLTEIGIGESQRVLDFGCGSGLYTIPAAKLVGGEGEIYALDKSAEALGTLKDSIKKEELGNVEIMLSSDLQIGLESDSLDTVLLYDVIHLIEDRPTLFAQIYKILKPNGIVSIYPMHVKKSEVLRQMREGHFLLKAEKYEGNILNFGKGDR